MLLKNDYVSVHSSALELESDKNKRSENKLIVFIWESHTANERNYEKEVCDMHQQKKNAHIFRSRNFEKEMWDPLG